MSARPIRLCGPIMDCEAGECVIASSPFDFKDSSPWMARFSTRILPDLDPAVPCIERHL
jgi:hypothetical protein